MDLVDRYHNSMDFACEFMSDKDKKLDFDLGFLDKELPKPKQPVRTDHAKTRSEATSSIKWNWKTISIIAGVIIVIIWIASSEDSTTPTSTYTPPSTNQIQNTSFEEDMVIIGEYSCARSHYNRAVELSPSESEQQIESASASMEYRANELNRLENEIQYSSITEYSPQYQIDDYNANINTYNSKLASYNRDAAALDSRIDRYNNQVEAHNNYLVRNCTPRR